MNKFGPKTTAAINRALPGFNGVLAASIPTTRFSVFRAIGITIFAILVAVLVPCVASACMGLYFLL